MPSNFHSFSHYFWVSPTIVAMAKSNMMTYTLLKIMQYIIRKVHGMTICAHINITNIGWSHHMGAQILQSIWIVSHSSLI